MIEKYDFHYSAREIVRGARRAARRVVVACAEHIPAALFVKQKHMILAPVFFDRRAHDRNSAHPPAKPVRMGYIF
ncbi:hypothetical protein [Aromatoleum anaerobium]|uniref:Uncharacterized protein n=1 Tax=Aromatoleum anaerobium TaxID=182180 RepID=A0ABX1PL02_9RHOO|nr:hypothetical protein [Aromatoleum anaerobium]MCK0509395.1 hypothetical protein [Aromatoleum anaerobium]